MSDTLPNIKIKSGVWVNLYEVTSISVGVRFEIQNISSNDIYLTSQRDEPEVPNACSNYSIISRGESKANDKGDFGAWAYSSNSDGLLRPRIV